MKKLYSVLAAGSGLVLVGAVGGMENGSLGMVAGCLICSAALAGWFGFTYAAGGFEEWEDIKNENL